MNDIFIEYIHVRERRHPRSQRVLGLDIKQCQCWNTIRDHHERVGCRPPRLQANAINIRNKTACESQLRDVRNAEQSFFAISALRAESDKTDIASVLTWGDFCARLFVVLPGTFVPGKLFTSLCGPQCSVLYALRVWSLCLSQRKSMEKKVHPANHHQRPALPVDRPRRNGQRECS